MSTDSVSNVCITIDTEGDSYTDGLDPKASWPSSVNTLNQSERFRENRTDRKI